MFMYRLSYELLIRLSFAVGGVLMLGLGATILQEGNVGLDPYTSSNIALAKVVGLSLGVYQLIVNLVFLALIFFIGRKYIGLGTLINMVCVGFLIDFFTGIFESLNLTATNLFQQVLFLIVGTGIFTLGVALYTGANLGSAPYDALAPAVVDHTKASYRMVRIIQDVSFTLLAFFLQGPVGVGTFINAFLTGPLISFWNEKVAQPLIHTSIAKVKHK
ncbi:hypothetical protein [Enterococcus asini]|uniref:YczE/YyaS/YitT family protein n=1 Tax=Enterococcus asini TaxID=57732 RepID=UPI002892D508|nr:hypothetical protein [Enterococcus asini]